jgi:hypothetical protein
LEYKNLIVELRQETDNQDFQPPVCELVDDLRAWEAEKGFKIDEVNLEFQENNIQRWLKPLAEIKPVKNRYVEWNIQPWKINEDNTGRYLVVNKFGVFQHIVDINNLQDLFELMDKAQKLVSHLSIKELESIGYLKKEEHTSWLGFQGQKVHAATAYFRKVGDEFRYYQIDTWCGGNHWNAVEHSPKPIYPNKKLVTCKKCLKVLDKQIENK